MTGNVFNIQRFCLHDGPGIRTTCFLMGCSLRCRWCHNPEGLDSRIKLQYHHKDCIGCQACQTVCPNGVHQLDETGHTVDFEKCTLCNKCVEICPTHALQQSGTVYTPRQLADVVVRDKTAYRQNGGVTFSGGEPLLQAQFAAETARVCKELGVPTVAVDTAGNVEWEAFETVLPWTDLFLFDVKAGTESTHILGTGTSNKRILENLKRLDETGKPIFIRVPVIGGINDSEQEIRAIAGILQKLQHIKEVRLLAYHTFGREKYRTIGLKETEIFETLDEQRINQLQKIIEM